MNKPAALKLDAKTITALVALVSALSGAVELRTKVGAIADRMDAVEKRLDRIEALVQDRFASR